MKLLYSLIIPFLFSIVVFSCQKNDFESTQFAAPPHSPVEINAYLENGTLHFPDAESFSKALHATHNASEEALDEWGKRTGFVSAYNLLTEAKEHLSIDTDMGKPSGYVAQYPHLFFHPVAGELDVKVQAKPVLRFLNSDRVLYIGNWLLKFTEVGEYIVSNGDHQLLSNIEANQTTVPGKCYFFNNSPTTAIERTCGYTIPDSYYYNASGNRRSKMYHQLYYIPYPEDEQGILFGVENWQDVGGRSEKRNVFGNWADYNTVHNLEWNFKVGIANENSLMFYQGFPTGVIIDLFSRDHKGSAQREDSKYIGYYGPFFKARNIPGAYLPYTNPYWEIIRSDKHKTQGIAPAWNTYSCQ